MLQRGHLQRWGSAWHCTNQECAEAIARGSPWQASDTCPYTLGLDIAWMGNPGTHPLRCGSTAPTFQPSGATGTSSNLSATFFWALVSLRAPARCDAPPSCPATASSPSKTPSKA